MRRKKTTTRRILLDCDKEWLKSRNWHEDSRGWRHPRLTFDWPGIDALKLQREADEGMQDYVHRALRGEDLVSRP